MIQTRRNLRRQLKMQFRIPRKLSIRKKSWAAYEEALKKAEEVLAKEDATQQEIDDAVAALDKASKALQAKGLPYEDVVESDWFYDEVAYNYYEEIMTGMDPTDLGRYVVLPRAQFATILHRIEGKPAAGVLRTDSRMYRMNSSIQRQFFGRQMRRSLPVTQIAVTLERMIRLPVSRW